MQKTVWNLLNALLSRYPLNSFYSDLLPGRAMGNPFATPQLDNIQKKVLVQ